ncbi:hypothetical protein DSO57_1002969 [Entomophthora muscae]|uniref:Uncharacterized protein n=1 Tax=Entomophthora muscae TaxID=34485 RepID=A0ACC2U6R5_9FUNG|nr:hypothetical protein DSO57_1002969 [Entomophthora muscae]
MTLGFSFPPVILDSRLSSDTSIIQDSTGLLSPLAEKQDNEPFTPSTRKTYEPAKPLIPIEDNLEPVFEPNRKQHRPSFLS